MTKNGTTLLLIATLLLPVRAAAADDPAAAEVEKREDQRVQAMVTADLAALADLLSDDLTYVHSSGVVDGKASFIDALRTGRLKYRSLEREGVVARAYGDAVVLTGRAHVVVQSSGNDLDIRLLFTDVWARRAGKWQMVAWHSARAPEK